jgi:hypothetical protein
VPDSAHLSREAELREAWRQNVEELRIVYRNVLLATEAENERHRKALIAIVTAPDDFNGPTLRMIAEEALDGP